MKTFFLFHSIYLSGGLLAFFLQFTYATKICKSEWNKDTAFKAALISFSSWMYVLVHGSLWLLNKVSREKDLVQ